MQHYPHKNLLKLRRAILSSLAAPVAFLISLLLPLFSKAWLLAAAVWLAAYLLAYFMYLPTQLKITSLHLSDREITLRTGVFSRRLQVLTLRGVQYVSLWQNPLERLFGLRSLHIIAPGGALRFPGLFGTSADALTAQIKRAGMQQ